MSDLDGCVYDTVPCCHSCQGCRYGWDICSKCSVYVDWPDIIEDGLCQECLEEKNEIRRNSE